MKTRAREEQMMVGYLLGTASELEQSQIETRYFREQPLFEQMLALEEELICDYVNETLSVTERQQFERHFLASPRRRRKFTATRKLMTFIADQGTTQPSTKPPSMWRGWLLNRTAWLSSLFAPKYSVVWTLATVTVLSFGVLMLSVRVAALRNQVEKTEAQQLVAKKLNQKAKTRPERAVNAGTDRSRNTMADIADQLQASLDPTFIESAIATEGAKIVSVNLRPSRVRGTAAAQTIVLQPDVTMLRLRMTLSPSDSSQIDNYNAVMKTLEGREVIRRHDVSKQVVQSGKSFLLEVPADKLASGYYALTLTGITASKDAKPSEEFFVQIVRD